VKLEPLHSNNNIPPRKDEETLPIEVQELLGDRLLLDASLKRYTAAQVGGPADGLIVIRSLEELEQTVGILWQHQCPFLILGGGSNVLVSDAGVRKIVLINRARQVHFDELNGQPIVRAESGANFGLVARLAAERGLSGLEWAAGIPGTVGGAVFGNAGAHGADIGANLLVADILHQTGGWESWPVNHFGFAYRDSALKRESMPDDQTYPTSPRTVIMSAVFQLIRSTTEEVQAKIDDFIIFRHKTQPPGASMGSMFKNPPADYAGRLIEAAGLKGHRLGDAKISDLHANFFINLGQARATDIHKLICLARESVFEKFGVKLDLEVELIGDWDIVGDEGT
jgi:UDP-N-acetylmuramate dehydrogenase